MIKQALIHYAFAGASCIALFAFLVVFIGVLFWVFRKDSKTAYAYIENLPLEEN